MSGAELATPPDAPETSGDPIASIKVLVAENAALVHRLRGTQIPQHVGMAAACRALAIEFPRSLAVQLDADVKSGVLAQRWDAARAAAAEAATGELDPSLVAITTLLRDQGRAIMRGLLERGKEWSADAYRLEGQAGALEVLNTRIRGIVDGSGVPEHAPSMSEQAAVVADDGAMTDR